MRNIFISFGFILLISTFFNVSAQQLPDGFVQQLLAENLDPTDMVIAPDGRIFITIKSGKILIVENDQLLPGSFLTIEVDNFNERGLGHMVLHPNFEINNFYYVYYTVKNTNRNRISRFTANGNSTLAGSELILLDLDPMAGTIHNAGAMEFGSDGKLYITTGDGSNSATAQSLSSLLGKILRINVDGSIPTDNPFYGTASGNYRAIYALGLRNPYSMDIQPGTDKIFVCDVGQSNWEEINSIVAGKNYGWPMIEGVRTNQTPPANYQDPFYAYSHAQGCAIVGSSFYNPEIVSFPSSYIGQFFYADYCSGYIRQLNPVSGIVSPFITGINRPLVIRTAPDGSLYYIARAGLGGGSEGDNTSSNDGTLWRVSYTGSGVPFISSHPKNILVPVGEDASFIISASGVQPLSYQWQLDYVDIPNATLSSYTLQGAQLADSGKEFRCVVSNSQGNTISNPATLSVTANTRPVPAIASPAVESTYRAGEVLTLNGSATDAEDGELSSDQLAWKIDFHHGTHAHPALGVTSGNALEFTIPQIGETSDNVWYRVHLTATDAEGLTQTTYVDVFPLKSSITLQTNPAGLTLYLDGQPTLTPVTVTSVVGVMRTLEAPVIQSSGGTQYIFNQWSESGLSRQFNFETPENAKTYTATFSVLPIGNGDGLKGSYFTNQSRTFNGEPTLVRTDATINFDWGGGSPSPQISADNFTVRWRGEVLAQFTDTYTFYTVSDDGVRLWVNNQLIIDKWIPQAPTEWSGTINLTEGERYSIRLEYFEDGGGAVSKLLWGTSKLPKQIIPTSQLFTELITGVGDELTTTLHVYPTLVNQSFTIERSEKTANPKMHWGIFSTLGQLVAEGELIMERQEVDLSSLKSGLYIFITSGNNSPVRIVKK